MSQVTHWTALGADGAVAGRRIVIAGAANKAAAQAANARAPLVGVSDRGDVADGEVVDVALQGIADVTFGAAVTRGDLLTADADGQAVPVSGPGLVLAHADGAAANADIAVSGILTTDEIVGVAATDGTDPGAVAIHSDGNIRCANATNNKELIVAYRRAQHFVGVALVSGVAGDIGQVTLAPGVK